MTARAPTVLPQSLHANTVRVVVAVGHVAATHLDVVDELAVEFAGALVTSELHLHLL